MFGKFYSAQVKVDDLSWMISISYNKKQMGNSSQKTFSQKLPDLQNICPRCDLMHINNSVNTQSIRTHLHYSQYSKPSSKAGIPLNKLDHPPTEYELCCRKNNRHIKYRLYRNIHLSPQQDNKKIYITNTKNKHRQNISPQELQRQIRSYLKRVTLNHPNIIKVVGIYQEYQCSKCKYQMPDLSILTEHLEPLIAMETMNRQAMGNIVRQWIQGVEYLGRQLGHRYKLNQKLLGVVETGRGQFVGKVWIEEELYKNQGIIFKTQIQNKQYEKTITNTISNILRNSNIPLNISNLTFKQAHQYLYHSCQQELINSPKYQEYSKHPNFFAYSSQEITNVSQQHKIDNIKSFQSQEVFLGSSPSKSTQKRRDDSNRKILVFSARKQAHFDHFQNLQKTIRPNHIKNKQSTIHQLQPPELSSQKRKQIQNIQTERCASRTQVKMTPQDIKRPTSVTSLTQASTFQASKNRQPSQHTINKNPKKLKKQSTLDITDHCNPINKIKSMTGICISQEQIQSSSPFNMILDQNPLTERYRKIKKITQKNHSIKQTSLKNHLRSNAFVTVPLNFKIKKDVQQERRINTQRLKTQQSKNCNSKKRSIEKSDLLKYQSYYERIITQPLPFSTPLKLQKQHTPKQQVKPKQNQQVDVPICHISDKIQAVQDEEKQQKFLDINFNYKEWKQWKKVHADSWEPSEENNYSEKREASFRISEKAEQSEISEFEEKLFMEKAKEYSELSEGAQQFINKNRGQINVIDSYLTVLDQQNKSLEKDKRYIVQESIIIKGLSEEKKTSTNTSKFLQNSYLKHKTAPRIIQEASSPIRKLNGLQTYKKLSVQSDNSTHNMDASVPNSEKN